MPSNLAQLTITVPAKVHAVINRFVELSGHAKDSPHAFNDTALAIFISSLYLMARCFPELRPTIDLVVDMAKGDELLAELTQSSEGEPTCSS